MFSEYDRANNAVNLWEAIGVGKEVEKKQSSVSAIRILAACVLVVRILSSSMDIYFDTADVVILEESFVQPFEDYGDTDRCAGFLFVAVVAAAY